MLLEISFLLILGLVFGSFITAISWRIPNEISFVKGRSMCPNCKKGIAWYDNIPLLSYLILGGKCRNCKKKISIRYPIIEVAAAIGFLVIGLAGFPNYLKTLYLLTIFVILLTIFVIDLEYQLIPDSLVFTGIVVVLLYSQFSNPYFPISALFSGFIAATFLMLIHLFTKGRGMGLGDVKLAVLGGMLTGPKNLVIWLLLAFIIGGFVGSILILFGKAHMKTKIAFGPFLILGLGLVALLGDKIMFYLGLF